MFRGTKKQITATEFALSLGSSGVRSRWLALGSPASLDALDASTGSLDALRACVEHPRAAVPASGGAGIDGEDEHADKADATAENEGEVVQAHEVNATDEADSENEDESEQVPEVDMKDEPAAEEEEEDDESESESVEDGDGGGGFLEIRLRQPLPAAVRRACECAAGARSCSYALRRAADRVQAPDELPHRDGGARHGWPVVGQRATRQPSEALHRVD